MPRYLFCLAVLIACPAARADEDAKAARALLDKAVAAMGGRKVIDAGPALTGASTGSTEVNESKITVKNEFAVQGTDKLKWTAEIVNNDSTSRFVVVLAGGKGWIAGNGNPASELNADVVKPFAQLFAALRVAETLTPLAEKSVTLSALGELKIGGKAALGLKAARKGEPDLEIYFDAKTLLPVRAEMRVKEATAEATYTATFGDYKKVAGRQHFLSLSVERDGKKVLQMERRDVKAREAFDDAEFAKP